MCKTELTRNGPVYQISFIRDIFFVIKFDYKLKKNTINYIYKNKNPNTVDFLSVCSNMAATYGLLPPQRDQQSEAGAAARVWLRL